MTVLKYVTSKEKGVAPLNIPDSMQLFRFFNFLGPVYHAALLFQSCTLSHKWFPSFFLYLFISPCSLSMLSLFVLTSGSERNAANATLKEGRGRVCGTL